MNNRKQKGKTIMAKIKVESAEISVIKVGDDDYISLTDMVREVENGSALIEKWLRNKNTIEFLGIWEEMYNPGFNSPEFGGIGRISRLKPAEKWGILISVLPTGAGIVDFKTERMFVV